MEFTDVTFKSGELTLAGQICRPKVAKSKLGVLFVQSGGLKPAQFYHEQWQTDLANHGYVSFSFDYRGKGQSEGEFSDSSLDNRLIDAKNALKYFVDSGLLSPNQIAAIGSSMGAHVAVRLANSAPEIRGLVLKGAAAYAAEVESKPMDSSFSQIIRRHDSWKTSQIFSTLRKLKIPTLLIYGQQDTVIPKGIQQEYAESIEGFGELLVVPSVGHSISASSPEVAAPAWYEVYQTTRNFISTINTAKE